MQQNFAVPLKSEALGQIDYRDYKGRKGKEDEKKEGNNTNRRAKPKYNPVYSNENKLSAARLNIRDILIERDYMDNRIQYSLLKDTVFN